MFKQRSGLSRPTSVLWENAGFPDDMGMVKSLVPIAGSHDVGGSLTYWHGSTFKKQQNGFQMTRIFLEQTKNHPKNRLVFKPKISDPSGAKEPPLPPSSSAQPWLLRAQLPLMPGSGKMAENPWNQWSFGRGKNMGNPRTKWIFDGKLLDINDGVSIAVFHSLMVFAQVRRPQVTKSLNSVL